MSASQQPIPSDAVAELATVRDWLRYAVSRFTEHGLVYGHGTDNAQDEAAFLILHTLRLPVDALEPWLDCRLTRNERETVAEILGKRIAVRKPAAYLTREAWIGSHSFYVDERVIVPRALLGELLRDGLSAVVPEPDAIARVLDLCTGSGCLAILAALAFPNATVDATDISRHALEVAARNVAEYGLEDRIRLHAGDLATGLGDARYDLVIANPPYVTAEAVADFPPEYAAEPQLAHLGGADGLDLVRRILADAPRRLSQDGLLVVEVGDRASAVEAAYPRLPFIWLDTEGSQGEVFAISALDLA